jgi:hypothetical protein
MKFVFIKGFRNRAIHIKPETILGAIAFALTQGSGSGISKQAVFHVRINLTRPTTFDPAEPLGKPREYFSLHPASFSEDGDGEQGKGDAGSP